MHGAYAILLAMSRHGSFIQNETMIYSSPIWVHNMHFMLKHLHVIYCLQRHKLLAFKYNKYFIYTYTELTTFMRMEEQ